MNEIDLRLLRAAVAISEELNFSRASVRLRISQPALTKQIQDLESLLKTTLFDRDHHSVVVTDAGKAFVAEAQLALVHQQRAVQAARSAANGAEAVITVGQSPYVDPFLTSVVSSVHLPLFPKLKLQVFSDYSPELTRRVAAGELDLALVSAGEDSKQLTLVELRRSPFFILLDQTAELARKRFVRIRDLEEVPWILFARHVHPSLYDLITEHALAMGVNPPERHHVTSAEQAAQLVQRTGGVAFLSKRGAWRVAVDSLTIRPLAEPDIEIKTAIAARSDAGRLVSEFIRASVRKIKTISSQEPIQLPMAI